jgi:hypothetical protein
MLSENFNYRNDAGCQPFRGLWLVQGNVSVDFFQPGQGQRRPADL